MTEVYNLRIGDLIYNKLDGANIIGLVYKMTPKYVYYAVCARTKGDENGDHYITKDHKVRKERLYEAIRTKHIEISYAQGINRRRKIKENTESR
tara:strand:+ start:244 stop:525 length:282 start_codon:yes stop_codon:yes gene_type:complete